LHRRCALLLILLFGCLPARSDAQPLVYLGALFESDIATLDRVADLVESPDGRFLYVMSIRGDAITTLARDPVTGLLSFVDAVVNGLDGVVGLDRPQGLSLSPDGEFLYVAAPPVVGASMITIFQRDALTGFLDLVGSVVEGDPGVTLLDEPLSVVVSHDGLNVYAPSFDQHAVTTFSRNPMTGALAQIDVDRDGIEVADGLEGAHDLAESPDGAHIYVASQSRPATIAGPGGVTVFTRAGDGSLDFVQLLMQGTMSVDGLQAARDIVVSPDGRHVYTANYGRTGAPAGPGGIAVFARNAVDGTLSFVESHTDVGLGIDNVTAVDISPDGSTVYLTAQGALNVGALAVFARDADTGELEPLDVLVDGVGGVDGLGYAFSVTASRDGAHVYVCAFLDPTNAGSAPAGAVSIFRVPEPSAGAAAMTAIAVLAARRWNRGSAAKIRVTVEIAGGR
jgi:6-phosphogluconolactonase (cycloisomerase 2 family)